MKFVFDKKFKFSEYPELLKCHNEYNHLVDIFYDMEEQYDLGNIKPWEEAKQRLEEYRTNDYAYQVYHEFYGKGLKVMDWETKKIDDFDEMIGKIFENLSHLNRVRLYSLVETKYGLKLPKEYYEKK